MCLSNLCEVEYKVSRGYVIAYKCVDEDNRTGDVGFDLKIGVNEAGLKPAVIHMGFTNEKNYKAGFHCFVNLKDAIRYKNSVEKIIKVLVKPEDIVATGNQLVSDYSFAPVIVAKKIKINSFKEM